MRLLWSAAECRRRRAPCEAIRPVIHVIDYGIGNLRSAEKALQATGAAVALCAEPSDLGGASGVVLPGVGSFGRCAAALESGGWREPITAVIDAGIPFLGICVGFQLLYEDSEESPGARGLGILSGRVRRLAGDVKLPQIQWNRLEIEQASTLFDPAVEQWMYFVHSFAPPVSERTTATCTYGGTVAASVEADNVLGVQFHPEKSGRQGLELLGRFAERAGAL